MSHQKIVAVTKPTMNEKVSRARADNRMMRYVANKIRPQVGQFKI
jgi:hypothetical protein